MAADSDFSHLIFYSLPFSFKHFYSIINEFKKSSSTEAAKIIFLFSEADIKYNRKIIKHLEQKELEANNENQLDFKGSVRYNKLSRRMENFMTFKNLVFKEDLFDLIANVSNFKEDKNES
jgi:single-stranded-DNA-specific exonuclease